jgi:hypothetical protein
MLCTEIHHAKGRDDNGRTLAPFVRHACKCDWCGRLGEFVYGSDTEWYRGLARARAKTDGFSEYSDARGVSRLRCANDCGAHHTDEVGK